MEKKVYVFKSYSSMDCDWPPNNLIAFYDWIAKKISEIPDEHKSSAKIVISSSVSNYDNSCSTPSLEIYYFRQETDEDIKERAYREERITKAKKESALKEIAKLRKIYNLD